MSHFPFADSLSRRRVSSVMGKYALEAPAGRLSALQHFTHRRRLARSCTQVVATSGRAARSTARGVLQREQRISSHGKPPLIAWSIVGEGETGPPSANIRSFQLSLIRALADEVVRLPDQRLARGALLGRPLARIVVTALARDSSFFSALRSPPDRGAGVCRLPDMLGLDPSRGPLSVMKKQLRAPSQEQSR